MPKTVQPILIFRDRQIADLRKVLADLDDDIPTVCVCGNHDIGDTPTHHTIQEIFDHRVVSEYIAL